jgi:hypothetical protein
LAHLLIEYAADAEAEAAGGQTSGELTGD